MINWGILGFGRMGSTFAEAIKETSNSKLISIGSKSQNKSDVNITNDYEEVIKNKNIDAIYIATLNNSHSKLISEILLPIEYVHEPNLITEVLKKLTRKRKTIAVVLDEYGGTAGLLTVEDIVEELFGEIEDEYDTIDHYEKKINLNSFEFSARLEIDYLIRKYKFDLPQDENYETLGGLIFHLTGEIPKKGKVLSVNDLELKVVSVLSNKIEKVAVKKLID